MRGAARCGSAITSAAPGGPASPGPSRRVGELITLEQMQPAGLAIFRARDAKKSQRYSHEQKDGQKLPPALEKQVRANAEAWAFFSAQPPWYRRAASWWVVSAKKEETRLKRLATLIADSQNARTIPPLTRPKKR